jgi:hypothetical protein
MMSESVSDRVASRRHKGGMGLQRSIMIGVRSERGFARLPYVSCLFLATISAHYPKPNELYVNERFS